MPIILDTDNYNIGLKNIKSSINNNVLTCEFTRENAISNIKNYFNLSATKYYLLMAYGRVIILIFKFNKTIKLIKFYSISFQMILKTTGQINFQAHIQLIFVQLQIHLMAL